MIAASAKIVNLTCDGATVVVHRAILCHFSSYFRAALDGPLSKGKDALDKIEDISKFELSILLGWMYTGSFHSTKSVENLDGSEACFLHLYTFADKHDIPAACKGIVSCMRERLIVPELSTVSDLFEVLPTQSIMSDYLVECYAGLSGSSEGLADLATLNPKFLAAVVRQQTEALKLQARRLQSFESSRAFAQSNDW